MPRKYYQGSIHPTKEYGNVLITEIIDKNKIKVQFIESGYTRIVQKYQLRLGKVTDFSRKSVMGVGIYDRDVIECEDRVLKTKAYRQWASMIERCYSETSTSYPNYGGKGVKVSDSWKTFSNFFEWFRENYKEGWHLESDVLSSNSQCSKVYSKETCFYCPPTLNLMIARSGKGVVHTDGPNPYVASVRTYDFNGKSSKKVHIGRFSSYRDARKAYIRHKWKEVIKNLNYFVRSQQLSREQFFIVKSYMKTKIKENENV